MKKSLKMLSNHYCWCHVTMWVWLLSSVCSMWDSVQRICFDVVKVQPLVNVFIYLSHHADVVPTDNVET